MKNKIGVVLATYNGEKYILEQLKSIINQTMIPSSIIISDGGSSDKTIDICEKYLATTNINYKILKSKTKLGVKDNFEKGLRQCNAKYIFFSDQDDCWLPQKIQNSVEIFEKYDADVVWCNAFITNENLEVKMNLWDSVGYKNSETINIYNKYDLNLQKELIKHNVMTGMCMAINIRIKNEIIPFSDYKIHDVWIAYASNCLGRVVSIDSKDVYYRQHGNNAIGTSSSIRKSLSHKNAYFVNLLNEKGFIEDVLLKYSNTKEKIFFDNYTKYLEYLNKRIDYIKKKKNILFIFSLLRDYGKYEYKCMRIIIRDLFTRITYKEAGECNEGRGVCNK